MKRTIKNIYLVAAIAATGLFQACSLDEVNPSSYSLESLATSTEGYEALLNQCYFGMERKFYGADNWMYLTEGDSDLWTYQGNISSQYTQWFWFFAGAAPNLTFFDGQWNAAYDGIGGCNLAISVIDNTPYKTEAERNAKVAQAHFMRAVYYFNIVEQVGGVIKLTEPQKTPNYAPERTDPMTIYREIIIPDLEFAIEWLPKGTDATTTEPTKKAALGFLAKACLQTKEYGTDEFLQKGFDAAKKLIQDCEGGGSQYGAYMYPTFEEVFAEKNNYENKEALWKHRWNPSGSSNGNHKLNMNYTYFRCDITRFGAYEKSMESRQTWEGADNGQFMPTWHLLNLFVQDDGSLDPRYHASFLTEWKANKDYTWTQDDITNYRKDASLKDEQIKSGDLAMKFVMPGDADYADEAAGKATANYLLVDYKDVYDDANKKVIDSYNGKENILHYFYPSLSKHNSSNFFIANAKKERIGNLNATFIMRMSEVYLIAAELDIYLNGGSGATAYINKVRARAGAKPMSGAATVRDVLDERGRELCGEYCRFYDLKRTGMFKDANYLQETNPDLAKYFKPEYALRPLPQAYLQALSNGDMLQNPGY